MDLEITYANKILADSNISINYINRKICDGCIRVLLHQHENLETTPSFRLET